MKSNYMNYFKNKKLYQWDKNQSVYTITDTNIEGEFCLDQQQMNLLLKFDNPEVAVGKTLNVKSGKTSASIKLIEGTLLLPSLEFTSEFTVNIDVLKLANNFIDKKGGRPILSGVNVNNFYIAATDGSSMYKHDCHSECNITIAGDFIKEISHAKGDVKFKVNNKVISCEIDGTTYIGRLLAGTYPNVANLYSNEGQNILIKKEELDIINYSNNKNDFLHIERNKLTLIGDNQIEQEINLNMDIDIWFNIEKISNAIKCVESEEINIRYLGSLKPLTINNEIMVLPIRKY